MTLTYKIKQINNNRSGEETPYYSVSLISENNITLDTIARRIQEDSSFTYGDVIGLIPELAFHLSNYLLQGKTVTLDGIGTFSLSAELKHPVSNPEDIHGSLLQIKRICFKAAPSLKKSIQSNASFRRMQNKSGRQR